MPRSVLSRLAYQSDHEMGKSDFSITADYHAKRNTLQTNVVFRMDEESRLHFSYNVSDERVEVLGIERVLHLGSGASEPVVDLSYRPGSRDAAAKMTYSVGNVQLAGWFTLRDAPNKKFSHHNEVFEVRRKFSGQKSVTLTHDVQGGWSRFQLAQVLDARHGLKIKCTGGPKTRFQVSSELSHKVSDTNDMVFGANWGNHSYTMEWKSTVADGKWVAKFQFPMFGRPRDGEVSIRRRIDF